MTLPASGPLAMTDIQTEFGGTNPIGLNEYYAGGGLVPAGTSGTYGAVPSSGALSIQNFYGTSQFIPVYIEELFSAFLYNGNGGANTITNGINLSGNGGLIWTKSRAETGNNWFVDTARGINFGLYSNATNAQFSDPGTFTSFNSTGYSMNNSYGDLNSGQAGRTYVSWTFRKQPKFFDVVTYTGTGAGNTINHNLGSTPGCIIIKRTSGTGNWATFARTGTTSSKFTYAYFNTASGLNLTAAAGATGVPAENLGYITATTFDVNNLNGSGTVGGADNINDSGATYVAYLFAHDAGGFGLTGTDNVISCGSYTGNGSTSGPVITLGYEPQWLLVKNASATWGWVLVDNMRGLPVGGTSRVLNPNTSDAEGGLNSFNVSATGFSPNSSGVFTNTNGNTYIYIAIRRGPMEVPTVGTSVFAPALGTSASTIPTFVTNFPVDLGFYHSRANTADWFLSSRLQGGGTLNTNTTFAEAVPDANYAFDSNTGWGKNFNSDKASSNFRRAPGFFDEVCWTGDSTNPRSISHNLTVAPTLIITKKRNSTSNWITGFDFTSTTYKYFFINDTGAANPETYASTPVYGGNPTASVFIVGNQGNINQSGDTYVSYLFASCPGVSSIGVVTHVEPTTVVCGFIPRFILIKSTQNTGTNDWFVFDSARGLVPGNDPYLRLNSTGAENTPYGPADLVDVTANGFIMNGFNGGNYLYLAIA